MKSCQIAAQIDEVGFCVCENFMSFLEMSPIRDDFQRLQLAGAFHRARVGQGAAQAIHDEVRRDEIYWLDQLRPNSAQQKLWSRLELLRTSFNSPPLYLGLSQFEGHYASYAEGGFYKRHRDSLKKNNQRIISFILYLNLNWQVDDGGQLRIFHGASYTDVRPIGGTMVCFLSDQFEHEVLRSQTLRHSFTGWFKNTAGAGSY